MKDLKYFHCEDPSFLPNYAYEAVDLTLLPPDYLSARLCILDFDEAFLRESPPPRLSRTPRQYLAPEAIFSLINGPAADIWALGLMLFSLRTCTQLFCDPVSCNPQSTVSRMCQVLGSLPPRWLDFPFRKGYPIHHLLGPYPPHSSFRDMQTDGGPDVRRLEQWVNGISEPREPGADSPQDFYLNLPEYWAGGSGEGEDEDYDAFLVRTTRPIAREDAVLFADLLRRIFTYDHEQRITAKEILQHPWLRLIAGG
jgi:serine/threonine protein kinase